MVEKAAAGVGVFGGDDEAGGAQGDEVLEGGVETFPARVVAVRSCPRNPIKPCDSKKKAPRNPDMPKFHCERMPGYWELQNQNRVD